MNITSACGGIENNCACCHSFSARIILTWVEIWPGLYAMLSHFLSFPTSTLWLRNMPTSVKVIANLAWATVTLYKVRTVGKICVDMGKNRIDCRHVKFEIPIRDLICTALACQGRRH